MGCQKLVGVFSQVGGVLKNNILRLKAAPSLWRYRNSLAAAGVAEVESMDGISTVCFEAEDAQLCPAPTPRGGRSCEMSVSSSCSWRDCLRATGSVMQVRPDGPNQPCCWQAANL